MCSYCNECEFVILMIQMCQSGFYETDLFRDNVKVKRCADVPINKSNNI